MAYDRDRYDRDRYGRDPFEREAYGRDRERYERDRPRYEERGIADRAGDEIKSWFGDDEARWRRERDEHERERWTRPDEDRWRGETDRYGRQYGAAGERHREVGRGPAFQPYSRGLEYATSQEYGREGYGTPRAAREWRSTESWRVPGPHVGRGPRGYQRSDDRIREEISDRLTAHGQIDASDVEVRVQGGEVTLIGFVDSRHAKRDAEDVAEDVQGVREVHNQLRVRSHAGDEGVGRTSVLGLTEGQTQTAETARHEPTRGRR